MNKKIFNVIGWIILIGLVFYWIANGYSDWNLVLLPVAYICFAIAGGSIKKIKQLSGAQILKIMLSFILSVAVVLGLVYLALYLINDVFRLQGGLKVFIEWVAILLVLLPVMFAFGGVLNRIDDELKEKYQESQAESSGNEALRLEAVELLKSMTKIKAVKEIRKRHRLSLVNAKEIVDTAENDD